MVRSAQTARANYGIDAPHVVAWLSVSGAGALLVGTAFGLWLRSSPHIAVPILITAVVTGAFCLLTAGAMAFGSKVLKLRLRDELLDDLGLVGSEVVLDVGCGRGLLLIGAARRLKDGQAVGIDLWQTQDQSGNDPEQTMANARAEGVAERIEIHTGDMRELPFADVRFDAVISSWAIHNVYDAAGREKALREVVRVLKPGGKVAIVDIRHAQEYADVLEACGLTGTRVSRPRFVFVVPSRIVTAAKP